MFPDDYVLVVDDDDGIRETVVEILGDAGIPAYGVGTGTAACRAADNRPPLVAVVDHRLPDMTGIDVVNRLKETDPALPVVLVTGFATLETAINAVGVVDEYLTKPVRPDRIVSAVRAKLESRRLKSENSDLLGRLERANAELEQMLAVRDAELEGVIEVASAVAGSGELEPVLHDALSAVSRAVGAETVALYVAAAGRADSLSLLMSEGSWSPPADVPVPTDAVSQGPLGAAAPWSTTVIVPAGGMVLGALVVADERRSTPRLLRAYAAMLAAPLRMLVPLGVPAARTGTTEASPRPAR